jgi:anti-anti-sigma factor
VSAHGLEIVTHSRATATGELRYVRAAGEVDLATADQLAGVLEPVGRGDAGGVLLDLRDVSFIDSSGLRVVMSAARRFESRFAVLVAEDSAVTQLLELVQLSKRVNAFTSEQEALAAVEAAQGDGHG